MYSFIVIHSWNKNFSEKTLQVRNFDSFILCQRERKRHWVVRRARPWVLLLRVVWSFYPRRQTSTSLKAPQWKCERRNLLQGDCVKHKTWSQLFILSRIVHPLKHLICEFSVICRFLIIYIQYLYITFTYYIHFMFLFNFKYVFCYVPFTLSHQ